MSEITFTLHCKDGQVCELPVEFDQLFAIGYAGRNLEKTMEHIRELEEQLGVPAPKKIPTIFQMSNQILTQDHELFFVGENTCGEVEYIIITQGEKLYIGLGSDHTDRALESASVPKAKQVSLKPIGRDVWEYEDMKDHWDSIRLRSFQTVGGEEIPYQDGSLADILPVDFLLHELETRVGDVSHSVIFSGTVPVLNGFKYGENFRCEMVDETLGRSLRMDYNIHVISEEER
ncbi:MAG: DUF2848 family protein [Oscillospiraceae bacterium]|nr:DUF2848 family protein [Oscillospiraceae bacterium]